jgi:transcriptional regulator with XRE-family HTH domain
MTQMALAQPVPDGQVTWLPERESDDAQRRHALGAFLRSRREAITPDQVGMPAAGRRRTPGLRREEVAYLAGVGVTWYTWLEQGRDITVSGQVLEAIARTLMFDPDERSHLFTLAGYGDHETQKECQSLSPSIQLMLDRLDPFPASVQNARYHILAFNDAYNDLIGDLSGLPFEDRNSMWLCFIHPQWRTAIVDWEDAAARMVANLRAVMAEHVAEPSWKALIVRLTEASPEFAAMWERQEVRSPENRTKAIINPKVGLLRLDYTHLWFGPRLGTRLVTYTPADPETQARLEKLAADRGA